MDVAEFLRAVITTDAGYFCLANRQGGAWNEQFMRWPDDLDKIMGTAAELREQGDVYFSAHLFESPRSLKANVLPTRTIQADLDHADTATVSVLPSILTQTSPGRHQGFWITQNSMDIPDLENISRRIAYGVPDCDRTGWPAGKKVRLPNTYNYKYDADKPHMVSVVGISMRELKMEHFNYFPELRISQEQAERDVDWIDNAVPELTVDAMNLLVEIKPLIPSRVFSQYTKPAKDRSAALWAFTVEVLRAGCSREQTFWLASFNANNKFAERPTGDRDLRKDILRAEQHMANRQSDIKAIIMDLRYKGKGEPAERSQAITSVVLNYMREHGEFVHTRGGGVYYLRHDTGRPMYLSAYSDWLNSYMNSTFGINGSEGIHKYVVYSLIGYCKTVTESADLIALSYYDKLSRTLLVHTGGRDVMYVSADRIETHPNGHGGTVFQWNTQTESIILDKPLDTPWYEFMFAGQLGNLTNLTTDEGVAILRAWTLFLLFRNMATNRPIMALVGQPGCASGDAVLGIRRGEHSERLYTLKEIYSRWHGLRQGKGTRPWDHSIPTRTWSLKDGIIACRNMSNIVYSGRKHTHTVTVGKDRRLRVTSDHKFLTPTGYRPLHELAVGDTVLVQGENLRSLGRLAATRSEVLAQYHPNARRRMVDGYGPYGFIVTYKAVYEAHLNGMLLAEFLSAVSDPDSAAKLRYLDKGIVIHHKDGDPTNNTVANLEALTKLEHDRLHGFQNVRNLGEWSGRYTEAVATITSIESYGMEDTYDITMEDEDAPNFLIGNVVVHNSGKTTSAKKIYRLIYGPYKSISEISDQDDFDLNTSNFPLVAYDNLDTWVSWLPNRLAAGTSNTDIVTRKLYTDGDVIIRTRQAVLLLTAHNPKFTREDVIDRMVMLIFARFDKHGSESAILDSVTINRGRIWASILRDVQAVLATPMPALGDCPQFRIEDFSYLGVWFSRAYGPDMEASFRRAINKIAGNQRSLVLEQDQTLVDAMHMMVAKYPDDEYVSTEVVHTRLLAYIKDVPMFLRAFRLPLHLGRKLWVSQNSLKDVFDIEWKYADNGLNKLWRIKAKENVHA